MLVQHCRRIGIVIILMGLSACNIIDDYMLGKDNTLLPTPLKPITSKFDFVENWSTSVGKSSKNTSELKLEPVLSQGIIYTATFDGYIQATQASNGKPLWSRKLNQHLISGPALNSSRIAVATDSSSVIILNRQDGKELWSSDLSSDSLSVPLITNNKIFVKSIDGNLYAFDAKTGEKIWVVDHGSPHLILKASSSPVLQDNLVIVGFSDGRLDAIDEETGHVVWQRNIAYATGGSDVERLIDIDADPVVRGDSIYLASYQGYIGEFSIKAADFVWRKPASVFKNILVENGAVYYIDSDSIIWALNRTNGQVIWKQPGLKAHGLTVPVSFGKYLLVGDKNGYIHGLAIESGELVSRTQIGSPVFATPMVVGSSVYILNVNGKLSRYSVRK